MTKYITVNLIGIVSELIGFNSGNICYPSVALEPVILLDDYLNNQINGYNFEKNYHCFNNYVDIFDTVIGGKYIVDSKNNIVLSSLPMEVLRKIESLKKGDIITFKAKIPYSFNDCKYSGNIRGYYFENPEEISDIRIFNSEEIAEKINKLVEDYIIVQPDYCCVNMNHSDMKIESIQDDSNERMLSNSL